MSEAFRKVCLHHQALYVILLYETFNIKNNRNIKKCSFGLVIFCNAFCDFINWILYFLYIIVIF